MTTTNKLATELKKAVPIFTDETLELLWKWFEAKQSEMYKKQLACLRNDTDLQKKISDITHSQFYKGLLP